MRQPLQLCAAVLLGVAISPDAGAQGQQCTLNSGCSGGLVCPWGRCQIECRTNEDCTEGRFCARALANDSPEGGDQWICAERDALDRRWFPASSFQDTVFWGGDLADMPLRRPEPLDCHSECIARADCRAWSYAPPGVAGRIVPWCYLKSGDWTPSFSAGSVSARVRR